MPEIITLRGSLRVVLEQLPYLQSAAVGVWVNVGSCNESRTNNGISHFIEHMLFKGTNSRSALDIAKSIDDIGGQMNAFTSKENTCFYVKLLSSHLDKAVELLSDMLLNSLFEEEDIKTEKKVILEEIAMYEDSPEELVHDLLQTSVWGDSFLGRAILGRRENVESFTREDILSYMQEWYTPTNSAIVIVGNFDRDKVVEMIERALDGWESANKRRRTAIVPSFRSKILQATKDTEQTHLCIAFEGFGRGHKMVYDAAIVNTMLGGGVSSRLFQNLRERRGLVYSVYSFNETYAHAGIFGVYLALNPQRLEESTKITLEEILSFTKSAEFEQEALRAKEQLKSSLVLGMEGTSARMNSYGRSLLGLGRVKTVEEIIDALEQVTPDTVRYAADKLFCSRPGFAIVGKQDGREILEGQSSIFPI